MTHIIRQQYLHVEVNGTESDGLALQRRLSDVCHHWLMPAIERALERCAPPDGHLYIDRLDIDVGTMELERLEHDLAELVAQAVEKSLRELPPPDASWPARISGNVQRKTEQQSIHEAFIYFLKTGSLPWSFRLPQGKNLEQTILDSWQEATQSGAVLRSIDTAVVQTLASATARKRLTYQFSPVFIDALLARLASEGKLASLLEHHWPEAIKKAPANRTKNTAPIPPEVPVAEKNVTDISDQPEMPETSPTTLGDQPETPETRPTTIGDQPDINEGIYIDLAGLVLLHPFLPRFFEALGIVAEDKLLQPDRALCLLHFLATGQHVAPEYALILPKILCNMPLEALVDAHIELTTAEQEEAVALLEAVIRHWEALRNTSIDGLRGAFLVRSGKVSRRDDGDWLLQVESKSYDILLEQLPWGVGIIKLPWMEKMLWVEWR